MQKKNKNWVKTRKLERGSRRANQPQKIKERQPDAPSGVVGQGVTVIRQLPAFGLRTRRRLNYSSKFSLTGSASLVNAYVFSANGPYDPDVSGTGSQPIFFDCMMTLYNHYTVLRSRIKVNIQNTGTVPAHVAVSVSGSSVVTTDDAQLIANGNMVYAIVMPSGIAQSTAQLRHSANAAYFQGIDNSLDDPNMRGDAVSNPTEQLYYHVSIWNPVSTTVPTARVDVEIHFDTVFHEPRKSALSISEMVDIQLNAQSERLVRMHISDSKTTGYEPLVYPLSAKGVPNYSTCKQQ